MEQAFKCMNHWLTVIPCTANNSVLGKDEFWDMVVLQNKLIPKDLLQHCNGISPLAIFDDLIISKGRGGEKKGKCPNTINAKAGKEKKDTEVQVIKRRDKDNDSSLYRD
eukprot:11578352-Ditylum_brightwellii.AAC.1